MCVFPPVKVKVKSLSHVQLFAASWTVALQAPPSMGFSRQEYWSGLPCSPPRDLPDLGIKPASLLPLSLAGGFFTSRATWDPGVKCRGWRWVQCEELTCRGQCDSYPGSSGRAIGGNALERFLQMPLGPWQLWPSKTHCVSP